MRSKPLVWTFLLGTLLVHGCADRPRSGPQGQESVARNFVVSTPQPDIMAAATPPATSALEEATAPPGRQLVRTVVLTAIVRDLEAALRRVRAIADSNQGYVARLEAGGEMTPTRAAIVLRIPGDRLDSTLEAIKQITEQVTHERSSLEDVTTQAVDLDARLRTLRTTERELLGLLGDTRGRGGKTEDILAVHRELTGMRAQIEQLQGQRDVLAKQVALATVSLELETARDEEPLTTDAWRPLDTMRRSVHALGVVARGLVDVAIYLVIVVLPVALAILTPAAWLARLWRRRRLATETASVET